MQPPGGYRPPAHPGYAGHGYAPQGPAPSPYGQPPLQQQPQQQVPGRIEVKVSYGARLGCAAAAAAVFLLIGVFVVADWALSEPPKTDPMDAGEKCFSGMSGPRLCHDSTSAGSKDYDWTAPAAGTYTFTVKSAPGARVARKIHVLDAKFSTAAYQTGTPGSDTVTSAALPAGKCTVSISDDPKPAGGYPFVLSIAKQGEPPPAAARPEQPFPLGLLAFGALGLVFLVIPLVLAAEKARIPRYIDPTGVTMRNGAHHPWAELRGVRRIIQRTRSGMLVDRGVLLTFARGSAELVYRPITNPEEVLWIVPSLEQGRNPWG